MSLRYLIPFSAAVLFHIALLFLLRLEQPALLPMGDDSRPVDVELVASAPAAAETEIMEPAVEPVPEPPQPEPVIEEPPIPPQPEPEPEVIEEPPPPTPEPEAMIEPVIAEPPPPPKSKPAPPKPRSPRSKPAVGPSAAVQSSAANPGPATGGTGGAAGNSKVRARFNPKPEYPPLARKQKQEGTVILSISVGVDGRTSSVRILRSSGFPLLDQAAVKAATRWRFDPARIAGMAVQSTVERPVRFALRD